MGEAGMCRSLEKKDSRAGRPTRYWCNTRGKEPNPQRCVKEQCERHETEEEWRGRMQRLWDGEGEGFNAETQRTETAAKSAETTGREEKEMPMGGTIKWNRPASETVEPARVERVGTPKEEKLLEWVQRRIAAGDSANSISREMGCTVSSIVSKLATVARGGPRVRRGIWDEDAAEALGENCPEGCEGLSVREVVKKLRAEGKTWGEVPKLLGLEVASSAVEKACRGKGKATAKASAETQRTQGTAQPQRTAETARDGEAKADGGDGGDGSHGLETSYTGIGRMLSDEHGRRLMPNGVVTEARLGAGELMAEFLSATGQFEVFGRYVATGEVG
jgi:hypothetical protein